MRQFPRRAMFSSQKIDLEEVRAMVYFNDVKGHHDLRHLMMASEE